jgi:hypothetical protein
LPITFRHRRIEASANVGVSCSQPTLHAWQQSAHNRTGLAISGVACWVLSYDLAAVLLSGLAWGYTEIIFKAVAEMGGVEKTAGYGDIGDGVITL